MSEMSFITIKGNKLRNGSRLIAKKNYGPLPTGSRVTIKLINRNGDGPQIGIVSDPRVEGWHNLDGACKDGHGYWVEPRHISEFFKTTSSDCMVKANVSYKNKSLKGMECSVLHELPKSKVFVELAEDVGGASCDGLGKKGHCVVLQRDQIGPVKAKSKRN